MIHEYTVESPASEKELGEKLRSQALGEGVLDVIVFDSLLSNNNEYIRRHFKLFIDSIHLTQPDSRLPYILGLLNEIIGEEQLPAGVGRLEVTGSSADPEDRRPLRLHTIK